MTSASVLATTIGSRRDVGPARRRVHRTRASGRSATGACDIVRGHAARCRSASTRHLRGVALSAGRRRRLHPRLVQAGVRAAGGDQLVVRAVLDEAPVVEHEHPVGRGPRSTGGGRWRSWCAPRRGAQGAARCGPRSAGRPTTSPRRGQHVGVGDVGAEQGDELALARRQLLAALAHRASAARRAGRRPSRRRRGGRTTSSISVDATCPGRAKPRLASIVSSNRNGSCGTTTSRSAQLVVGDVVQRRRRRGGSRRSSGRRSGRSAGRACVLPEPVAPTTATCWPAGMCTRDVDAARRRRPRSSDAAGRVRERDLVARRCRAARAAAGAASARAAAGRRAGRARRARDAGRRPRSASGRAPR